MSKSHHTLLADQAQGYLATSNLEEPLFVDSITHDEAISRVSNKFQYFVLAVLACNYGLNAIVKSGFTWLEYLPKEDVVCILSDGSGSEPCTLEQYCENQDKYSSIKEQDNQLVNWMSDLDLFCVSKSQIASYAAIFFIGFTIASPIMLRIADIVGRRVLVHISLISHAALLGLMLLLTVSTRWLLFVYVLLFGIKSPLTEQVSYILMTQLTPSKNRALFSSLLRTMDGLFSLSIVIEFQLIRDWKVIFLIFIGISMVLFILVWIVPPSPAFQASKGNFKKARKLYERIAKLTRSQMFQNKFKDEEQAKLRAILHQGRQMYKISKQQLHQAQERETTVREPEQPSMRTDLFEEETLHNDEGIKEICKAGRRVVVPLLIFCMLWLIGELIYYGINFGIKDFSGDIFINSLVVRSAQIVAYIGSGFLANSIGRKLTIILGFVLITIFGVLYVILISYWAIGGYIALLFVELGASIVLNMDYLLVAELFPTSIKGTVMGFTNFFARLGCILAPYGGEFLGSYSLLLYAALSLVCGIMSFKLSETKGQSMKQTLADMLEEEEPLDHPN